MSIDKTEEENEREIHAIPHAQAQFMAARVAMTQQALSGKQPIGTMALQTAARLHALNEKAGRENIPVSSVISEVVSRGVDARRNRGAQQPKGVDMAALRRAGALGRFSQLEQLARDNAAAHASDNADPIIGFCQVTGIPVEKLFSFLIAEAEARQSGDLPAETPPADFGIPESEDDLSMNQVIEIARKWGIGPGGKAIRNRATKFFKRADGDTDYNENGKRFILPREAAIEFLRDLKRTTF